MITPKSLIRRGQAYNARDGFDETFQDGEAATATSKWEVLLLDPRDFKSPATDPVYPSPAASATIEELPDSPTLLNQIFDPARAILSYNAHPSSTGAMSQSRSNTTSYHGYSTHPGAPKNFRPGPANQVFDQTFQAATDSQNRTGVKGEVDPPHSLRPSYDHQKHSSRGATAAKGAPHPAGFGALPEKAGRPTGMYDRTKSMVTGDQLGYSGRAEASLPQAQYATYKTRLRPNALGQNAPLPEVTVREIIPAGAGHTSNNADPLRSRAAVPETSFQEPRGKSITHGILRSTTRKRDSTEVGDNNDQYSAATLSRPTGGNVPRLDIANFSALADFATPVKVLQNIDVQALWQNALRSADKNVFQAKNDWTDVKEHVAAFDEFIMNASTQLAGLRGLYDRLIQEKDGVLDDKEDMTLRYHEARKSMSNSAIDLQGMTTEFKSSKRPRMIEYSKGARAEL